MTCLQNQENTFLWDGKNYRTEMLKHDMPDLFGYRTKNDTLYSKPTFHVIQTEHYFVPRTLICASLIAATIVTLISATSPELREWPALFPLIWVCVFGFSFGVGSVQNAIYNFKTSFLAPLISTKDGFSTITYYKRVMFPFYSKVTHQVPSHIIILEKNESAPVLRGDSSIFLLEVTEIYESISGVLSKYLVIVEDDDIKKHFLECRVDNSLSEIWESYVNLTQRKSQPEM